ncbi:hypothetical protein CRE_28903 [Caenorhabditis remanei]|uniref:E3 ubiquitin-protein ligase n=1 Tax=Caenorhabditis remanei TaxID=31234 RepID=E3MXF5_CAERE|nr:hypothetical protein CRE_28903 [Caenorhabditis remanei]
MYRHPDFVTVLIKSTDFKSLRFLQPCVSQPLAWKPRRILRPPTNFEDLFARYYHRECMKCSKHAECCSSSSGLFISLTSSMILVSRGRQSAIWGTVYLDAHKEEDRNLKRGKPLYLCETRLRWLEYDWADQEWQRVYQWYSMFHSNVFINSIRDCHLHQ